MTRIEVVQTDEVTSSELQNYTEAFNLAFNLSISPKDFRSKYKSFLGFSFHSFLISEEEIVGSVTVIPMEYKLHNKTIFGGLIVDVFILPEHRSDPFHLLKMYRSLKPFLIQENITFSIAVPNKNVSTYWTKIMRFNTLGELDYNISIVDIFLGRIGHLGGILTSLLLAPLHLCNYVLTKGTNRNLKVMQLVRSSDFYEHRLKDTHKRILFRGHELHYVVGKERNVNVAFLLDFSSRLGDDANALRAAVKYIKNEERISLILFIGQLNLNQYLFWKLPKFLEPQKLPVIIDNLDNNDELLNMPLDLWDFTLLNYDVR